MKCRMIMVKTASGTFVILSCLALFLQAVNCEDAKASKKVAKYTVNETDRSNPKTVSLETLTKALKSLMDRPKRSDFDKTARKIGGSQTKVRSMKLRKFIPTVRVSSVKKEKAVDIGDLWKKAETETQQLSKKIKDYWQNIAGIFV